MTKPAPNSLLGLLLRLTVFLLSAFALLIVAAGLVGRTQHGRMIAYTCDEAWSICLVDIRLGKVFSITHDGTFNSFQAWSPDGGQIAFRSNRNGHYDIHVMDANGSYVRNLTNQMTTDETAHSWSLDGKQIAFYDLDSDAIYVINADGSNLRYVADYTLGNEFLEWSPDEEWLALSTYRNGDSDIYIIDVSEENDADGRQMRNLTNNPANDFFPVWSPNGARIAFVSDRNGNDEIYIMDADGSHVYKLTNNYPMSFYYSPPAWSPDGAQIAFSSIRNGDVDIYVIDTEGGSVRNLTNNHPGSDRNPAWSPDGTQIAFSSTHNGNDEIYVMDADGSNLHLLVSNGSSRFAWQP